MPQVLTKLLGSLPDKSNGGDTKDTDSNVRSLFFTLYLPVPFPSIPPNSNILPSGQKAYENKGSIWVAATCW